MKFRLSCGARCAGSCASFDDNASARVLHGALSRRAAGERDYSKPFWKMPSPCAGPAICTTNSLPLPWMSMRQPEL